MLDVNSCRSLRRVILSGAQRSRRILAPSKMGAGNRNRLHFLSPVRREKIKVATSVCRFADSHL